MKKSRDCYLKLLSDTIENKVEQKKSNFPALTPEDAAGMISVFDDYIFSLWLSLGDTAFNRLGYRNATDDLLEQLKKHV